MDRSIDVPSKIVSFGIQPLNGSSNYKITGWTVDDLIGDTQVVDWSEMRKEFCHLKDIPFSPLPKKSAKIDILIGTDNAYLIAPFESRHGGKEDPVAVRTRLGWACFGRASSLTAYRSRQKNLSQLTTSFCHFKCDSRAAGDVLKELNLLSKRDTLKKEIVLSPKEKDSLELIVERQWALEEMGLKEELPKFANAHKQAKPKESWSEHEKLVDQRMKVEYLPEIQKYQASIPWKNGRPNLVCNKKQVIARQMRCNNPTSLVKKGTSIEEFEKIFKNYLEKGYIEPVPKSDSENLKSFWLPYFAVVDQSRDTTKC
jgi:hypothetical protein